MAEFSIESVCQAIKQFNAGQQVDLSDAYLRKFSSSPEAWGLCIQVLQSNPEKELVFQLLRIFKSKIQYDFISLKPQEVSHIQQAALQIVRIFGNASEKSSRIQCVLIFIVLYIYTYDQNFKLLEFLTTNFESCNGGPYEQFLFEVLETLPEELVRNSSLVIDEEILKRIQIDVKQKQMLPIIEFLQSQWTNTANDKIRFHILRAYKKWLEFIKHNLNQDEIAHFLVISSNCPLFKGSLQCINQVELQSKAVESISTFVSIIPKAIAQNLTLEPNIVALLFEEIFKSFQLCDLALREDNGEESHNLIKLYTKVGKKFIHKLLLNQQLEGFFTTMLAIFCHQNSFDECELLVDFWIKMISVLKTIDDATTTQKFGQIFERLINGCIVKTRVPTEYFVEYGITPKIDDDFEQVIEVRGQMKEVIQELVTIVKPCMVIQFIAGIINTEFVRHETEAAWITFESCIHLLSGIVKQIQLQQDTQGLKYLMEIIGLYLQRQDTLAQNNLVMKSVFKTISKGGTQFISDQQMLPQLFNFITIGINHSVSSVQRRAAKAFQTICEQNQTFVLQHINEFIDLLVKMQSMSNYDNLVKGIANAVCSTEENIQLYYVKLCSIFAQNLQGLQEKIQNSDSTQFKQLTKQIGKNISNLSYINNQFPNYDEQAEQQQLQQIQQIRGLIVTAYQELWPMLQFALERIAPIETSIAEKIVKLTKYTFRKTYNSFKVDLLTQVFTCFLNVYKTYPVSACIYVAEVAATVFYRYSEYRTILIEVFESVCTITFQHLPQLSSFEENPDLTEDFFGMLVRYGRYTPALLLQSPGLSTILQLTGIAIGVEHTHAAKSFYSWLEIALKILKPIDDTFKTPIPIEYKNNFQNIMIGFIPEYTSKLFFALRKGPTDEEVEDYIEDCIMVLPLLQCIDFKILLEKVLEEGAQNIVTHSEKQAILDNFNDKDKLEQFLKLYTKRSMQRQQRV